MVAFLAVLDKLFTLFLLLVAGYTARKLNVVNDGFTENVSSFLTKIVLPSLLIMSFQISFTPELLKQGLIVFFACIAMHVLSMIIGFITAKMFYITYSVMGVWVFSCMFANIGFMGIPVISAVLGDSAVFYCAFANFAFNVMAYTIGIFIISRYSDVKKAKIPLKKILFTPANLAIIIGILLFLTKITLPSSIGNTLGSIGSITTPLAMIYIGAVLTKNSIKEMFSDVRAYLVSFIRLVVIPIASYFVLKFFISDKIILGVVVLGLATPIGTFCAIFSGEYGGDVLLSSKFIFVSTFLCMITMPFISLLFI